MEILGVIAEILIWLLCGWEWGTSDGRTTASPNSAGVRTLGVVNAKETCTFCRRTRGRFVTCKTCRTPHHSDCARLNRRCAVYGCRDRTFLVPAA